MYPSNGCVPTTLFRAFYPSDLAEKLKEIQSEILGNQEELRLEKGGIAFERRPQRAENNSKGPRCYTIGTSFQKIPKITAPSANMKAGFDQPLDLEKKILKVMCSLKLSFITIQLQLSIFHLAQCLGFNRSSHMSISS